MRCALRWFILFTMLPALLAGGAAAQGREDAFAALEPGTIVIKTAERRLYLMSAGGETKSYPVAVGRPGQQWSGTSAITGKYLEPAWQAPVALRRGPGDARVIPGGSPRNPMGAAALTLSGGDYAIHGTNNPASIGTFASAGCIRMHNRDILDLYRRVRVGTRVLVMP
jgi:lipoprotein-anchoring transpeptidase ErfK/SrfK